LIDWIFKVVDVEGPVDGGRLELISIESRVLGTLAIKCEGSKWGERGDFEDASVIVASGLLSTETLEEMSEVGASVEESIIVWEATSSIS
jgi:hypothetical protein